MLICIRKLIVPKIRLELSANFRYELPRREGYCSGDLFGYLFAVPCNVDDWLMATYGKDFMTKKAADWERKNGTYRGPENFHVYGTYEDSLVIKGFYKHPLYGK